VYHRPLDIAPFCNVFKLNPLLSRSYYGQNKMGGQFSFEQVESLVSGLQGRVLMVLPERYAGRLKILRLLSMHSLIFAYPQVPRCRTIQF
jgi:hypothetical protein